MLSYHNDENLKDMIVSEMKKHQEQDQFVKGGYDETENGKFKGCAVGCAINSINVTLNEEYDTSDHSIFEEALGIPEWLAHLQDCLFENLPNGENSQFAVDFLSSIPVGVDLNPVRWKFCSFLLKEGIERMLLQPHLSDELRAEVVAAIRGVLDVHESAIRTGVWDAKSASSAGSAARAAYTAASTTSDTVFSAYVAEYVAECTARAAVYSAYSVESSEFDTGFAAYAAACAARSAEYSSACTARSAACAARSSASAWSARSARSSVSESAAESADSARSAASSVADWVRSAAWSAALASSYKRYSAELLRILKESKG